MSEQELYNLLTTLNLEVAYDHFNKKVEPPFILYKNTDSSSFFGEDKTYFRFNQYIVDLVTSKKDTTLENNLEALLDDNYIPYSKTEDFIENERVYQIRYFL